jgi:hypothetical protein
MKRVTHNTYIQYIRNIIHHKIASNIHNFKINSDKFFNITKPVFKDGQFKYFFIFTILIQSSPLKASLAVRLFVTA